MSHCVTTILSLWHVGMSQRSWVPSLALWRIRATYWINKAIICNITYSQAHQSDFYERHHSFFPLQLSFHILVILTSVIKICMVIYTKLDIEFSGRMLGHDNDAFGPEYSEWSTVSNAELMTLIRKPRSYTLFLIYSMR